MGLFFRPRRPLLRLAAGAATAGVAYHAGQRRAEQDAYNQQAADAYQATQAPPPPPAPPPAAAAAPTDTIAELERLSRLHESGALTDQEFAWRSPPGTSWPPTWRAGRRRSPRST